MCAHSYVRVRACMPFLVSISVVVFAKSDHYDSVTKSMRTLKEAGTAGASKRR